LSARCDERVRLVRDGDTMSRALRLPLVASTLASGKARANQQPTCAGAEAAVRYHLNDWTTASPAVTAR
jgi:hypothetical protein